MNESYINTKLCFYSWTIQIFRLSISKNDFALRKVINKLFAVFHHYHHVLAKEVSERDNVPRVTLGETLGRTEVIFVIFF